MKLSLIDKRIPQTLTNSKDIIQKDREHARQSSLTRSTRGQENEAWAVYKKDPSQESWDDLSGDQYIICLKPPSPAGKILDRRQLFFLANHNSLEQTITEPGLPVVLGNFWRLEQIFVVLATSSKFCLSEQLLSKYRFRAHIYQARKSQPFRRKLQSFIF